VRSSSSSLRPQSLQSEHLHHHFTLYTLPTTPNTPTLLVIATMMRLSCPIPPEIWEGVMSHLEDDRQTLKAVILADCLASSAATRIYWQNTLACKGLLTELEKQPQNEQQFLASLIHAVVIDFKLPYDEHEGRGLCFPLMRSLTIEHNPALIGRHGRVYARTKHLVGPLLRDLDVGCQSGAYDHVEPITDNFMPRLSVSISLRSLMVRARVKGATSGELVLVLQKCTKLQVLHLEKHTEDLVDGAVVEAIAAHPSIMDLMLEKRLDRSLTLSIAEVPEPFKSVSFLELCADTAATRLAVSRLENLQTLYLTATGMSSIFPYLSGLKNLRSIWIKFVSYSLTDDDLTYLITLKKLQFIEFGDCNLQGRPLQASFIRGDLLAAVLGSLPLLYTFILHAINTLGDPFLLALGRQCRNLQDLTLMGQYTLEPLADEIPLVFPRLTSLQLGSLSPSAPIRQYGGFREDWADQRAQDVIRHAPNLLWFETHEGRGYGDMVDDAWKRLKSEAHVYVGGR
jgi:hypothetical protein